jgi:hypothetical protein
MFTILDETITLQPALGWQLEKALSKKTEVEYCPDAHLSERERVGSGTVTALDGSLADIEYKAADGATHTKAGVPVADLWLNPLKQCAKNLRKIQQVRPSLVHPNSTQVHCGHTFAAAPLKKNLPRLKEKVPCLLASFLDQSAEGAVNTHGDSICKRYAALESDFGLAGNVITRATSRWPTGAMTCSRSAGCWPRTSRGRSPTGTLSFRDTLQPWTPAALYTCNLVHLRLAS